MGGSNSYVSYNDNIEEEETVALYSIVSGKIKEDYIYQLNNYEISDPNSEKILEYCVWEDYRNLDAYKNCVVKNSDYYRTVTTKYTLKDLQKAIKTFTDNDEYLWHIKKMENNYLKINSKILTTDEKKACSLVLSYYTGFKDNSDRSSRNTNVLIRGGNDK